MPTVNGVTSTALNGTYKQGQMIAITIEFSEVVNVTGTPQLTLETGGSDAVVDYSGVGSGTNTLTFNYTIGAGQTSGDLDYVANNSLALNGGTIRDAALNDATLTLANPNAVNSLRANKNLIVDTSAPTAFTAGSVLTTGGTVVAGKWNTTNTGINVTVPLANDASLTGGTLQIIANVAGGGYENLGGAHTILIGELGTNKTLSFNAATFSALSGGLNNSEVIVFNAIITDKAGNATTGTQSGTTINYDTSSPEISAAKTLDDDKDGQIDQILVTLTEAITDGSSTLDNTTFTVAGYTVSNTTTGTSANDNKVLITLTESGSADTDATPNVELVAAKISDGSNLSLIHI